MVPAHTVSSLDVNDGTHRSPPPRASLGRRKVLHSTQPSSHTRRKQPEGRCSCRWRRDIVPGIETDVADGVTTATSGGWAASALIAVVAAAAVIVLVAVIRERYHRRRRTALENQLASLEGVLVNLAGEISTDEPSSSSSTSACDESSSDIRSGDSFSPRGPLSTAISILCADGTRQLPAPDRIDLRATCYVYDNLDQPLSPADLAGGLNISLRTLQRGLSTSLGCSPRELILAIKMREAKRHLIDDGARVQEAARAVGFDDPFHFSRRFKAYYGVSPTEMQARISRSVA